jgi:hypothetical protein
MNRSDNYARSTALTILRTNRQGNPCPQSCDWSGKAKIAMVYQKISFEPACNF